MNGIMIYYKKIKDGEIDSLEERISISTDSNMIQIDEDEYNTLMNEFESRWEIEMNKLISEEISKDQKIAELEAENAALLYQILTGEEL